MFEDKNAARARLLKVRAGIENRHELSESIARRAAELAEGNVMLYIAMGTEAETYPLAMRLADKPGVTLFAPYTSGGIITPRKISCFGKPNRMGNMPEECYAVSGEKSTKIDCCITPLVGFNKELFRIGYGMGCYDRYFAEQKCKKIGLAFSVQYANFLPDAHDVSLDCCVTEKDVLYS